MNRLIAPEIKPIDTLKTGFPVKRKNLYRIDSEEGVFKLDIVFPGAGYGLIDNKFDGLYGMDLMLSGTGSMDANQIADSIDELGCFVFKSCDYYNASVTLYGLNENLLNVLHLVKSSIDDCIFDKHELSIFKQKKISELNINLNKTSYLANRQIHHSLFGVNHPFALSSSVDLINNIKSEDLSDYKSNYLKDPYFIFTGSSKTSLEEILTQCGFSLLEMEIKSIIELLPNNSIQEVEVTKEGSTQNSIRFGKIMPSREHRDYFKISLLNIVIGGYFGSRLMKNIREEKGLTYGIQSSISPFKDFCLFKISSECNKQFTAQVKEEIEKEVSLLQTVPIGQEELMITKNYLLGALSRNFDGAFNISDRFKTFLELDTKPGFYEEYFSCIKTIGAEDLMECANNYFKVETFNYCIAGEI